MAATSLYGERRPCLQSSSFHYVTKSMSLGMAILRGMMNSHKPKSKKISGVCVKNRFIVNIT